MIVACGEALIDLVPVSVSDEVAYLPRAGGCSYNVAIGAARLGVPTAYLGRISRDRFGRLLEARLVANGIDLRYLSRGDEPTTLAVVELAAGQEPGFAFYGEGTADRLLRLADVPPIADDVAAMHFGSISLTREPGASTYEALIRREHGRRVIALDPNVRPGLIADRAAYVARLEGWLARCDLVKASRADLGWLYPGLEPAEAARRWRALGPAIVAVTNGAAGAMGLSATGRAEVAGVEVAVADTVGAGDAFGAAMLAWLAEQGRLDRASLDALGEAELAACLGFATRVAALTCMRAGAEPPTREELGA
jgi:fructokinase